MENIKRLLILYIIIIIVQISYTLYNVNYNKEIKNVDKKIKFNLDNYAKVEGKLKNELSKRVNLLMSGKMSYNDWLKYNEENILVDISGNKYYFFVYERGIDPNEITTIKSLVYASKEHLNLEWRDIYKEVINHFVFLNQTVNMELTKNAFEIARRGITELKYYWPDPLENVPVEKLSFLFTIPKDDIHNELLIGIGMDVKNLDRKNRIYYVQEIYMIYVIFLSLLSLFISILISLYKSSGYSRKQYSFLIITNLYLLYFLNNSEYKGTSESEIMKIDQTSNALLSVSFLVGVNTFIITSLTNFYDKSLFSQSAIVFALSVILLLASAFKITDYVTLDEIIKTRISNQLLFNFSILMNGFVVLNYIMYIIKTYKGFEK